MLNPKRTTHERRPAFDTERCAAIADIEDMGRRLGATTGTRTEFVRAMAAYMRTLDAYERVGCDGASRRAWGVFRDGRVHVVAHDAVSSAARSADGRTVFPITPVMRVDRALEQLPGMREALAHGRLTYFTARNGLTKTILGIVYPDHDTRYAISERFARARRAGVTGGAVQAQVLSGAR